MSHPKRNTGHAGDDFYSVHSLANSVAIH